MSGVPGSGKSTIARTLGSAVGAVVLDHDVSKNAVLSAGLENDLAGRASFAVIAFGRGNGPPPLGLYAIPIFGP